MPSKSTYFKVGLFTIIGMGIFCGAVLFFGLSQAFQPILHCETFFNHSVQGLRNGATVMFRGFTVGSVTDIAIAQFPGEQGGRQMVKVNFNVTPGLITGIHGQDAWDARKFLEAEIDRGLRIYLSLQGVSGITYLNLDYVDQPSDRNSPPRSLTQSMNDKQTRHSDEPIPGMGHAPGEGPVAGPVAEPRPGTTLGPEPIRPVIPGDTALVIPSMPSTILEIGESMTQIVRAFREIDFKSLVDRTTSLVTNLEEITGQLKDEQGGLSNSLLAAIGETREAAAQVGKLAKDMDVELTAFLHGSQIRELELTLADTRRTLNRLDSLMKSPQATLPTTLDNLRVMSENLREFSEMARRYPSQILLGAPPPVGK
ncbi:MAG: MlaD family protein [Deltaproteobacteria bacterium]|jgi:hypothetical protein|nr:MlaD family protein [Deltaproteobacteria bacterium]